MIDWEEFKKRIGNGKTKIVSRDKQKSEFVSFNSETDEVTIIKNRSSRKLYVMPRKHFIEDFTFIREENRRPLF